MNKNLFIVLLLPIIKSLSLSFRAKVKPIISHYYRHINIDLQKALHGQEAVYFLNVHVFTVLYGSMSNNLNLFFLKIDLSYNFILKLVMMFSLLNTDCRVDLPNFILISSYSIIADKGLEYIYKHQNLATVNPSD